MLRPGGLKIHLFGGYAKRANQVFCSNQGGRKPGLAGLRMLLICTFGIREGGGNMKNKVALVAGASGIRGRGVVEHLTNLDDWDIIGLARRPYDKGRGRFLAVDLLDLDDCKIKLGGLGQITHVFYAAYQERPTEGEQVAVNVTMLRNLVATVETAARCLEHVCLFGREDQGVRLPVRPLQDAGPGDRSTAYAAELLLRPGGFPAGAAAGQDVVLVSPEAQPRLWARGRPPDEPRDGDRHLRIDLQGTGVAAVVPRHAGRLHAAVRSDGCRSTGSGHGLGRNGTLLC